MYVELKTSTYYYRIYYDSILDPKHKSILPRIQILQLGVTCFHSAMSNRELMISNSGALINDAHIKIWILVAANFTGVTL
jgi:hypothetical protein